MARADRGGETMSIRFNDATGPHSQVAGAAAIPSPSEFGAMLMPTGANSLEEKKGLSPWLSAYAGQLMTQRVRAPSPQPHVVTVRGWGRTCHHKIRDTT